MTFKYVIYKMRGGVEGCEGPRVIWTVDLPRIPCSVQAIRIYIEAENRSAKPKSRDCCSWMSKCTGLYHVRVVLPLMCSLVCVVCSLCLNHSCIFSNNSSNNLIDKQFDKTFVLIDCLWDPCSFHVSFAGKYLVCLLVLRFVLPSQSRKLKWVVSSGLAQVSEFSFVLGSRARHLKIISREVGCFKIFIRRN